MTLMRLILLVLLGVMIRRIYRSVRSSMAGATPPRSGGPGSDSAKAGSPEYSDLTEQGIDDADFEEIP